MRPEEEDEDPFRPEYTLEDEEGEYGEWDDDVEDVDLDDRNEDDWGL